MNLKDGSQHNVEHMNKPKSHFGELLGGIGLGKPEEDKSLFPVLNWRKLGNYEETNLASRTGPGEYGAKVTALPSEKEAVDASIKEFGFNMVNSDKISLDRLPKDLRHQE